MSTASRLVKGAFTRLAALPGFTDRPDQRQLALLLCDLIEDGSYGLFEAPTGLGKSLAALIPAIAHGLANGVRVAIATYTNVLAEQYWRQDLPMALSLFDVPDTYQPRFLIGKQRYACRAALDEHHGPLSSSWRPQLGIETELRQSRLVSGRQIASVWRQITAPVVCEGRRCPHYDDCFYYSARRLAAKAPLVITNHSVVLLDSMAEEGQGLLGSLDYLILDEAHDLPQAAAGAFDFELSPGFLLSLSSIAGRLEELLGDRALPKAQRLVAGFRAAIEEHLNELGRIAAPTSSAILSVSPVELEEHPALKNLRIDPTSAKALACRVAETTAALTDSFQSLLAELEEGGLDARLLESAVAHLRFLDEAAGDCARLFARSDVSVTHQRNFPEPVVRNDMVDYSGPLQEFLWPRTPAACLSATLTLDGTFEYFRRNTGIPKGFEERLPSPFDFRTQAAAYVPPPGRIPDPGQARKFGQEEAYYDAVARELEHIIDLVGGRTLVLFHSRREMESVAERVRIPEQYPVHVQPKTGAAAVGKRFIKDVSSCFFALRSFWTGFDAPGETLSCVVLVRVPFEVPTEPPALTRMAHMQSQGLDPFHSHALPLAKMLMRQGAGRLIRRTEDRGVIALLDPRLRTKAYGEAILNNLPEGMRVFSDMADAASILGESSKNSPLAHVVQN
jgi:ATP-dependent DNA helicase DinG